MNYDYSYNVSYMFKTIGENAYYQYDFCRVFLCKEYNDNVLKIQDSILKQFENNEKLQNILDVGVDNGFGLPIKMDKKTTFSFLFSYDYFYYIHKCLQDLFNNNDISTDNYDNLIKLLKK
jgi:hypothetical protein